MEEAKEHLYNIRQVIELTGITEFTLRAWEGRYRSFEPARTPTGRRLYSRIDILRIKALLDLTSRGFRISKIAHFNIVELQKLLETPTPTLVLKIDKNAKDFILLLKYVDRFDWDRVLHIIYKTRRLLEPIPWIFEFLLPLIHQINIRVAKGQFSISQEHIITAFIKENLFAIRSDHFRQRGRKTLNLVIATPEGDIHELGILISSVLSTLAGIKTLYLGPNVPKQDLCESCLRYQASHLLISSTVSPSDGAQDELLNYIHFIDRHLNKNITLWLGGPGTKGLSLALNRNLLILNSLEEFQSQLYIKRSAP